MACVMEIEMGLPRADNRMESSHQSSGLTDTLHKSSHPWQQDIYKASQNACVISIRALLEGHILGQTLRDYAKTFPNSDPRASSSYWSLFYFARLTSSYFSAARHGFAPSLDLDDVAIVLEPDGLVKSFHYSTGKVGQFTYCDQSAVQSLIDGHLEYFIGRMKEVAGLSQKLLWNNAAVYIDYALKGDSDCGSSGSVQSPKASICNLACFADGSLNPISGCLKIEENGETFTCRRKVCCLRYQLPGIPSCGALCAKPEIRIQESLSHYTARVIDRF